MHQSAVPSIASNDNRIDVVGPAVTSSATQRNDKRDHTWLVEIEPLTIVIHCLGHSYVASLIDRWLRCTVELPVETDLESAKNSALAYAEQYMHLQIGEASW